MDLHARKLCMRRRRLEAASFSNGAFVSCELTPLPAIPLPKIASPHILGEVFLVRVEIELDLVHVEMEVEIDREIRGSFTQRHHVAGPSCSTSQRAHRCFALAKCTKLKCRKSLR